MRGCTLVHMQRVYVVDVVVLIAADLDPVAVMGALAAGAEGPRQRWR